MEPDFEKKNLWPKFGPNGPTSVSKLEYNDSLQQFGTCSRGKILEKKFLHVNLGQRGQNWS